MTLANKVYLATSGSAMIAEDIKFRESLAMKGLVQFIFFLKGGGGILY